MNFGPSVVTFNVLGNLGATNTVEFDVSAADVPGTRETTLRPQVAVLAVTRPAAASAPRLAIGVQQGQMQLSIDGQAGRTCTILSSTNLADWGEAGGVVSTNAVTLWSVPATNHYLFFKVRTP